MSFQMDLDTLGTVYYYDRADQVRSTYFCQVSEWLRNEMVFCFSVFSTIFFIIF